MPLLALKSLTVSERPRQGFDSTQHIEDKHMKAKNLPKIGIRPTIDNRRMGVRESLEDQTMDMARLTADFLQKNLRHASGEPVECVIADTCIGGMAEAAACEDKFKASNVGL